MSLVSDFLPNFNKTIEYFKGELNTLKTGRANPAILDGIMVEAYGVKTPLNQLSSISVPEARSILIQPWDKTVLKDTEKALRESDLGINPVNEGDKIRLTLPLLTEESRKEIVKVLHQKMEEARIAVRKIRDEAKEEILMTAKEKVFGEDEKFALLEELDKVSGEFKEKIDGLGEEKEAEIMKV